MNKFKLFLGIACCIFSIFLALGAKADLFLGNQNGQSQFQLASINQAQVMQAPPRSGGITINVADRPRQPVVRQPVTYNYYDIDYNYNFNFNFNNFSNYYYFTNVDYIYNNFHSSFDSDDYYCWYQSGNHASNYGYGLGYSAAYVITYDPNFYDDCFFGDGGYGHGGGNNNGGNNCRLIFCAADNTYKVGCAHNNYQIDCGTSNCRPRNCPTGYTGTIPGRFVNGVCNYSDLSTCRPTGVVCTQEARLCPDGSPMPRNPQTCEWLPNQCSGGPVVCTAEQRFCADGSPMPRNTQTCEWLPNQCPSTPPPTCTCPVVAAPNCGINGILDTENYTITCSGTTQTRTCTRPVCRVNNTTSCNTTCPSGTPNAGQQVTGTLLNGQCVVPPGSCGTRVPTGTV